MFDRFSAAARLVVANAEEEARSLGHVHVGTEHLLLGLLADRDSAAGRALAEVGVTPAACRSKVREAVGGTATTASAGELPLTDRAKRALGRAGRVANRRRDEYVEPGHILLSVIEVEGRAGQVLRGLSIDVGALQQAVLSAMVSPAPAQPVQVQAIDLDEAPCRCASCGAALEDTLTHQAVASRNAADQRKFVVAYCSACGRAVGVTQGWA